jgi:hypothetical protein
MRPIAAARPVSESQRIWKLCREGVNIGRDDIATI